MMSIEGGRSHAGVILFFVILLVRIAPVLAVYKLTGSAVLNPFELDPVLYLGGAGSIVASGINEFPFFAPLNFQFIAGLLFLGGGNALLPALANACVGWLTVVVLYFLARELFDERSALIAAALMGLYPNFVFYGITFYAETLAVFFIVCSFFLLVRYFNTDQLRYVLSAGIMWGLASQTRGGLHFFSLGLCVAIILHVRNKCLLGSLKLFCVLLASVYSVIAVVGLMAAPFNEGMTLNSKSGMGSVLHGANRVINCSSDYGLYRESLFYAIFDVGEPWPEGSHPYSDELIQQDALTIMSVFMAFVMQDPLSYVKSGFERLSFFWSPNQLMIKFLKLRAYYRAPLVIDVLCLALSLLFAGVLCAGCMGFVHARDPFRSLCALFFVFYCVLIFFTTGNAKLRLPLMPFIMMYAGYFCSLLVGRKTAFTKLSAACCVFVCGLIIVNGIYRYQDIAISPGEFNVRQAETSFNLGFPKTALFLLEKNMVFQHYTEQQELRLKQLRQKLYERGYQ